MNVKKQKFIRYQPRPAAARTVHVRLYLEMTHTIGLGTEPLCDFQMGKTPLVVGMPAKEGYTLKRGGYF